MNRVKPKKHLGQHFLTDLNIAKKIVESLDISTPMPVLEIGPGMGVLTQFLVKRPECNTTVVELDQESVVYLENLYPELPIIPGDFLKLNLNSHFQEPFALIGNFPYNISSQIFFRLLENRNLIPLCVGMIQKEVAERIAAKPGNKTYGILSVLLQAWYDIEYLFTVHENVFNPPPKVKSAVIRLKRNKVQQLPCDEALFFRIVKMGFNQRRKTLRNSLKAILPENQEPLAEFLPKRPEQLSVEEFIQLACLMEGK